MPYYDNHPFDVPATQQGSAEEPPDSVGDLLEELLEALRKRSEDKQRRPVGFSHPTKQPRRRRNKK